MVHTQNCKNTHYYPRALIQWQSGPGIFSGNCRNWHGQQFITRRFRRVDAWQSIKGQRNRRHYQHNHYQYYHRVQNTLRKIGFSQGVCVPSTTDAAPNPTETVLLIAIEIFVESRPLRYVFPFRHAQKNLLVELP